MKNVLTKQDNLNVKITCSGLEESVVIRADIAERISELFEIDVIIQMKDVADTSKLVDKPACVTLLLPDNKERYFSGIVREASIENIPNFEDKPTRANNIVCLKIVPTVFRLTLNRKYRIFQEMSAIEIIEKVLKDNSISDIKKSVTSAGKNKRIFCVQYAETDMHFISRLMEEEGIFYYFLHEKNKDTFCFSDNSGGVKKISPTLVLYKHLHTEYSFIDSVYNISIKESSGIKNSLSLSFNEDKFSPVSGKSTDSGEKYNIGSIETYDFPFEDASSGNSMSKNVLESQNSLNKVINCQSSCPHIYTGCICSIKNSAISSQNGDFFVVEARHTINQITDGEKVPFYENKLKLIPNSVKFRPNYAHKKNRIHGTQTATVTGASNEEIFCDEKGRIKIKFHWDSVSEKDEKSSCWVRVAHSWAGKSFGELVIPRVGMEVVVNFVNGDPDQPLVTGCVYNGVNVPPSDYAKNKKTASTFYTHSEKGFNELRFEDAKDKEEIYIHAQKDLNSVIENSVTETLNEGSKTVTLESKKDKVQHIIIVKKGDYQTTINEGDMSITMDKGNQTVTLKEGNQMIVLKKGDLEVDITGNISIKAKNIDIDAEGTFSVNSMKAMSFETKDSASFKTTKDFIVNSTMKTTISAKMDINIESKLNLTEKGLNINRDANVGISDKAKANLTIESSAIASFKANAMMDINGGGMLKIAGGMIKLN